MAQSLRWPIEKRRSSASCIVRSAEDTRTPPKRAMRKPQLHTDDFKTPDEVMLRTIAVVCSPYKERFGCPRQPTVTSGVLGGSSQEGVLKFTNDERFKLALEDLDGFEYIWIISYLHMNQGWSPKVTPPRGPRQKRGLFATRSPHRPNHIALSACQVAGVNTTGLAISVRGLDLLDGTPVLDVKPYVPYCDSFPKARAGWIDEVAQDSNEPDHLTYSPPPRHLDS